MSPAAARRTWRRSRRWRCVSRRSRWIQGNFQVERIDLVQPTIVLERCRRAGQLAIRPRRRRAATTPSGGGGRPDVRLDDIRIANGTLIYRDAAAKRAEDRVAECQPGGASLRGPFRAGGNLSFQGVPVMFKVSTGELDPARRRRSTSPSASAARAARATPFKFSGTVASAPDGVRAVGRLELGTPIWRSRSTAWRPARRRAADRRRQAVPDRGRRRLFRRRRRDSESDGRARRHDRHRLRQVHAGHAGQGRGQAGLNRLDLDKLLASMAAPGAGNAAPAGTEEGRRLQPPAGHRRIARRRGRGHQLSRRRHQRRPHGGRAGRREGEGQRVRHCCRAAPASRPPAPWPPPMAVDAYPVVGALEAKSDNLRGLLEWLHLQLPQVPADRLRTLALTSNVTATPAKVQIAKLNLKLDSRRSRAPPTSRCPGRAATIWRSARACTSISSISMPICRRRRSRRAKPRQGKKKGGLPLDSLAPLARINANLDLGADKLILNEQTLQGVQARRARCRTAPSPCAS